MIEDLLYREELLEVFQNPKNRGKIANPDLEAKLLNPLCGDVVTLQIKLNGGKVVQKAVFSGNGCAISQASASLLAENIEGKNLEQIRKLKSNDILALVGINPTPARMKCALLSLDVLMEAIKQNGSKS